MKKPTSTKGRKVSREELLFRLGRAEAFHERVLINGVMQISTGRLHPETIQERREVEKEIADLKEELGLKY